MIQPMTHRLTYQRRTPRDPKPLADLAAATAEVEQAARELAALVATRDDADARALRAETSTS